MKIQNNIKEIIKEKKIKVVDMARDLGVSKNLIHLWKSNKIQPTNTSRSEYTIETLCDYLGVKEEDIFYITYSKK